MDRRGRHIEVSGLSRAYHVYVLASRLGGLWTQRSLGPQTRTVATSVLFQTFPQPQEVPVKRVFDGSSPYKTPTKLRVDDVVDVAVGAPADGGLPVGMTVGFMLSPDLLHDLRFPPGHDESVAPQDLHVVEMELPSARRWP